MSSRADEAVAFAAEIYGRPVDRVERMVKSSVRAIRLHIGEDTIVAARRPSDERAELEARVLKELHAHGAPVPDCIGRRGQWVLQSNLDGQRLSVELWKGTRNPMDLMSSGLSALRDIQDAGRAAGLSNSVAQLGTALIWRTRLAAMPQRLAQVTGVAAPELDTDALGGRMAPARFDLLKWDARPANAMVRPDGRIFWFDWEHCGVRDPLDDAAWFLGDEYAPENGPGPEDAVKALLPQDDSRSGDEALQYLLRFGVFHISVRLALILQKRDEYDGWRDWDMSLELDKVGCTAESFRRTTRHAARWADMSDDLRILAPWFRALEDWCPDE
jgi:hypothetical protein